MSSYNELRYDFRLREVSVMRSLDLAGGSVAQTDVRNSCMLDIIKPNIR